MRRIFIYTALAAFALAAAGLAFAPSLSAQDKSDPEAKKGAPDLFELLKQKGEMKPDVSLPPALPLPTVPPGELPLPKPAPIAPAPVAPPGLPTPAPAPAQQPLPQNPIPPQPPSATPRIADDPTGQALRPIPFDPGLPANNGELPGKPAQAPGKEPSLIKGSAWSLHVEVGSDGQTVVTATVSKRHEFRIVCQHVDLQTGAGQMKARGKVQISGDALTGSCDQLVLPLHDDRLLLDGNAEVRIQKTTATAFELKGDKLDLRISDLQSSARLDTGWRTVSGDIGEGKTVRAVMRDSNDSKNWTSYGTLRNTKSNESNLWGLVGADGKVIAYVLARDGGSLERYVGRTIAVYGPREGERNGYPVVRATHIAVP